MIVLNGTAAIIVDPGTDRPTVILADVEWSDGTVLLGRGAEVSILPLDGFDRCAGPPAPLQLAFGEGFALFAAMDDIRGRCAGGQSARCVEAVIAALDVTRDRRLSAAEIARGLRAFGALVAYETAAARQRADAGALASMEADAVPLDTVLGGVVGIGVAGPLVTRSLLASYDFDGDGFLGAAEVLQDREGLDMDALSAALAARLGEDGLRGALSALVAAVADVAGPGLMAAVLGLR